MTIERSNPMSDEPSQIETSFLVAEYGQLNSHIQAFWKMRLTVVVASIGLHGYLVKLLVFDAGDVSYQRTLAAMLLLVAAYFASVSLVATLTRPLWIFSKRMENIGTQFTEGEFWASWNAMSVKNPSHSSLHPFYSLFMVIGGMVSLAISVSVYSAGWLNNCPMATGLLVLLCTVLASSMLYFTRCQLHVKNVSNKTS